MRRGLIWLSVTTTSLVVIAFLVPTGLILRLQADDRTRDEASQIANTYAGLVAVMSSLDADPTVIDSGLVEFSDGVIIVTSGGRILGQPETGQGTLVDLAITTQDSVAAFVNNGYEVAVPVSAGGDITVVDVFVSEDDLTSGVFETWLALTALGVVLIAGAAWASSYLGRRLVRPIDELSRAADGMARGDLSARVRPGGPPEVERLGKSFNTLAGTLDELIAAERESIADLSHRLRTPISALRLRTEKLTNQDDVAAVSSHIDKLDREIDALIAASRTPRKSPPTHSDLNRAIRRRVEFWRVLATEQGRDLTVAIGADPIVVSLSEGDIDEALDVLIENVFSHTEPGIGIAIATGREGEQGWFEVSDWGPGFTNVRVVKRGVSGDGSTGLGLDIVRRIAIKGGGGIEIHNRPGEVSGAVVRVMVSLAG